MESWAKKSWAAPGTGGLPGTAPRSPLSRPRRLGLLVGVGLGRPRRGILRARGRCRHRSPGQCGPDGRTCAERPPAPPQQQPAPPAAGAPNATREKSKQRRIGFCSIRGAGGGKSMFSKWEKRKSFRKDSLFPSQRGVRKQHRPLRRKRRGPSTPRARQARR